VQLPNVLLFSVLAFAYAVLYLAGAARLSAFFPAPELMQLLWLPLAVTALRARIFKHVLSLPGREALARRFYAAEPLAFAPLLAALAFPSGLLKAQTAMTVAVLVLLVLLQVALYMAAAGARERARTAASPHYIALLFLVSGFAALIYQVVWQRTLFAAFGINSESVTIIVSVFMFGLGVGALAGGALQQRFPRHLLQLFLGLELLIGAFGLVSLDLIAMVSAAAGDASATQLMLWVYVILAIPTLLMGATLPILVAWLQGHLRNIGQSVGLLYAFNTIGSAIAAFLTVMMLFVLGGQRSAVLVAAACNFATALLIWDASRKIRRQAAPAPPAAPALLRGEGERLPFGLIFAVLMAIGFISLSQEILWFRLLGYLSGSRPQVFGLLLAAFLTGIACGALRSRVLCGEGRALSWQIARALLLAAVIFYLALPATALLARVAGQALASLFAYGAIGMVAYYTGGILPLLVHLGIAARTGNSAGALSWLYFANIIGATLGPLVTGFFLLEHWTLAQNIALSSGLTLALLVALALAAPQARAWKGRAVALVLALSAAGWLLHGPLFEHHLERLQYGAYAAAPFRHVLQNRGGIITVEAGEVDTMYGNGIYDGRYNTDIVNNTNLIDRAYMVAALHRRPQRVLEIGLSTGSWARVLSTYGPLVRMDVVEINPGYPAVMRHYPAIAPVLDDAKVNLHLDDGRRWLRNHPQEKFDLIVMNTTYHWRSNTTNLLSSEFLELARRHLLPGGVLYYNPTSSQDVLHTAATVFRHVTMFSTFVAASDAPFDMSVAERRANLLQFLMPDGKPLFDSSPAHRALLARYSRQALPDRGGEFRGWQQAWRITDDNMAVEYKTPRF
jgi:spermidine synthase